MKKDNLIYISHVKKYYETGGETVKALDDISLEINKGDFVAFIGPSGAGKSTLMNILGCLDVVSDGEYFLDGIDTKTLKDDELSIIRNEKIGFVFQNFNLLSNLTAYENVELPLIYRGLSNSERKKRVVQSLVDVGLEKRIQHTPFELSGGQQQRVSIARALVGNPQILLADEPTGALDSKTSEYILNIFKELNVNGQTIILITHDLDIAKQADRIFHIRDGKLFNE